MKIVSSRNAFQPPPRPANPLARSGAIPGHQSPGDPGATFGLGNGFPAAAKVGDNRADKFASMLVDEMREVNSMQNTADANVHQLLTGGDVNEAEVLTSVQKADLAFRMLLQVRNKLMEAYREIQQIQI